MRTERSYRETYEEGRKRLEEIGLPDAALDARILLEEVCGTQMQTLLIHPERLVTEEELAAYQEFVDRRAQREPTAMILGKWDFMGLTFQLNGSTLIPEQDTERLVEVVLESVEGGNLSCAGARCLPDAGDINTRSHGTRSLSDTGGATAENFAKEEPMQGQGKRASARILDLCTGSGCILLSLLHFLPEASGLGTDLSSEALEAAVRNRESLGLERRAALRQGDLWEPVGEERFDIIVSNPPYVPTMVIPTLEPEVRCGEPYAALDGGEDGLVFYRSILEKAAEHLTPGGWIFLESGFDEAADICRLMEENGFTKIRVYQDYGGLDRVVAGEMYV